MNGTFCASPAQKDCVEDDFAYAKTENVRIGQEHIGTDGHVPPLDEARQTQLKGSHHGYNQEFPEGTSSHPTIITIWIHPDESIRTSQHESFTLLQQCALGSFI
jgi:hypothetical protein